VAPPGDGSPMPPPEPRAVFTGAGVMLAIAGGAVCA
jgi:hypothetical protein